MTHVDARDVGCELEVFGTGYRRLRHRSEMEGKVLFD